MVEGAREGRKHLLKKIPVRKHLFKKVPVRDLLPVLMLGPKKITDFWFCLIFLQDTEGPDKKKSFL